MTFVLRSNLLSLNAESTNLLFLHHQLEDSFLWRSVLIKQISNQFHYSIQTPSGTNNQLLGLLIINVNAVHALNLFNQTINLIIAQ